jgi:hypothetical protein
MQNYRWLLVVILTLLVACTESNTATRAGVAGISPVPNSILPFGNSSIRVRFAQDARWDQQSMVVRGTQSGRKKGLWTGSGGSEAEFRPESPFWPGEEIEITLTNKVKYVSDGIGLEPVVYKFRAGTAKEKSHGFAIETKLDLGDIAARVLLVNDLNQDRALDLVTSKGQVLLGDGLGAFDVGRILDPNGIGAEVVSGDFNLDGKVDLAGLTDSGTDSNLKVFLGDGNGAFLSSFVYSIGKRAYHLKAADFNGDGISDLLIVGREDNIVSLFVGKNQGKFILLKSLSIGYGGSFFDVNDIDLDKIPDIIFSIESEIRVLFGLGKGDFSVPVVSNLKDEQGNVCSYCRPILLGDFNKDKLLDMIYVYSGGIPRSFFEVALGVGEGRFSNTLPPQIVNTGGNGRVTNAISADFNGDKAADLLLVSNDGAPEYFGYSGGILILGKGNGEFLEPFYFGERHVYDVSVGDFNGDGNIDVINSGTLYFETGSNYSDTIMIPGDGKGRFLDVKTLPSGKRVFPNSDLIVPNSNFFCSGTALDFNGDGKLDLLRVNKQEGTLRFLKNIGLGTLDTSFDLHSAGNSCESVISDVNGDFLPDIVVANESTGSLMVFSGNPLGKFENPTLVQLGRSPKSILQGDLNADGNVDLVVGFNDTGNDIQVLLGNGTNGFTVGGNASIGENVLPKILNDFNDDGRIDLVSTTFGNTINILYGNGDGSFAKPENYDVSEVSRGEYLNSASEYFDVNSLDVNGDNQLDMVVRSGIRSIFMSNTAGKFQISNSDEKPVKIPPISRPRYYLPTVLGDFNGDGKTEILNFNSNRYESGSFIGNSANICTTGDFNNDGRLDVYFCDGKDGIILKK